MKYKTIDLCAGIGGIRRGFELTGKFENVISAEIDESACKTYQYLYGENPRNDLTSDKFKNTLKSLRYDILMAGFPCQSFSSVGLKKGFEDKTKGTIFFDIAQIIKNTSPKAVFLENVENLVTHEKGHTFQTIIETLEIELNYKVIGVHKSDRGDLEYNPRAFIRNSKFFGIPQNRPRVYIIAFSRNHFGTAVNELPTELPQGRKSVIYETIKDVLQEKVDAKYFLSSGYLETLEKHAKRQKEKGYGFGYKIINSPEIKYPIANTLLATGGSGKERNLVIDLENGIGYSGKEISGKKSPINSKCIRSLTPNEWGKLQGFINYAFLDSEGRDSFAFPDGISDAQKYKQFGNSVTIPVIESMAQFIDECLSRMVN